MKHVATNDRHGIIKNLFNSTFFGLPENVYRHESSEFGDGD